MSDRNRARELLDRDHLEAWEVRELRDIVDRNQNDGVLSETEWIVLSGWAKTEADRLLLRAQARGVFAQKRGGQ